MTTPINPAEPMFQIVFNNSLISYPLLSVSTFLVLVLLIVFSVAVIFLKKLPEHIYKKFENQFNRETELLKLIRSQVEPRKVDAYISISDIYSEIASKQAAVLQGLPPGDELKEAEKQRASLQNLSRLFLFATDDTIRKFLDFKRKNNPLQSFDLYADFIASMRKDLHEDSTLKAQDFIDVVITHKSPQPEKNNRDCTIG